ncbi:MAG: hypothetical protein MUF00_02535 [Gemmatimonadaceae bacterium]|jgi:hypothetical protein|nr:hypothetical protein [Gemmatimonadaceae bacterium]
MRITSLLAPLSLLAAPIAIAGAQSPSAPPRVVATYTLRAPTGPLAFPRAITVSDSAGVLIASLRVGTASDVPMTVETIGHSLVLQGATADGVLTLLLEDGNAGNPARQRRGRWTLGTAEGALRVAARG